MGVAYINGFQKRGGPFSVLGNAKHYLGDGGTMNGVNAGDTSGDETTLRALHLAPYQAAVSAGVGRSWPPTAAGRGRGCTWTR